MNAPLCKWFFFENIPSIFEITTDVPNPYPELLHLSPSCPHGPQQFEVLNRVKNVSRFFWDFTWGFQGFVWDTQILQGFCLIFLADLIMCSFHLPMHLCVSSTNSEDQQDIPDQKSKLVEEAVQKAKEANNLFPDDINK